jgi:thiol-disulfide isomerase/thioredoxin
VSDLRGHAMQRLVIHTEPKDRIAAEFVDADGATLTFADFEGRVLVVNFWATWCPPCRAEMPSLDRLSEQLGTEDFAVVALSTDFGGMAKPKAFFEEIGVTLPLYQDTTRGVAREAAVMGLPVTLLLDRSGREVARLIGDAEWDSPEAVAVLKAIAESGGPQG